MEIMHIGIPVTESQANEEYVEGLKLHLVSPDTNEMKFEFLRFEEETPMHPDIVNNMHVAYKVNSLEPFLEKYEVLCEPMAISDELSIAFVKINNVVVEIMEFKN